MYSQRIKNKNLSLPQLKLFRDLIYEKSGIYLNDNKFNPLSISLLARITQNKFNDYSEYYNFIKYDPAGETEFKELLNLITINETCFFRNPAQFKALQDVVIPEILNKKKGANKKINIWAAGCSSGEEPYTIAMILIHTILDIRDWNIHILGTDVNPHVLELAQKGVYQKWSMRLVNENYRISCFDRIDENNYAIKENIKKLVEYKYFNLIEIPYPLSEMKNWDIIFCRNVTIYFKHESTERVIHNFYNSLLEGGYLFIGHSETLNQCKESFTLVEYKNAFFYRKGIPDTLNITVKRNIAWEKDDDKSGLIQLPERRKNVIEADVTKSKYSEDKRRNKEKEKIQSLEITSPSKLKHCIREESELLLKKAEEFLNNGKTDEALKLCLEAKEVDPLFYESYFFLGVIYKDNGNICESIIQFEKVIYINPCCFLAHFYLGDLYFQIDELEKSIISYNNAIKYSSTNENKEGQSRFDEIMSRQTLVQVCKNNIKKIKES
ncbi:hypothetical protein HY745_08955 [Candidatus Desantisbacteria bacterium]|nr:hypothetical protein [Candidatus Desantisbacteria bacterium]